tara:strand:- start:1958 stop:2161 length:204 start_codon:yes stop_codon:yes gene_type:complete
MLNILKILLLASVITAATEKVEHDFSPLVPMSDYSKNSRALNCWECFEANGKMCYDPLQGSLTDAVA